MPRFLSRLLLASLACAAVVGCADEGVHERVPEVVAASARVTDGHAAEARAPILAPEAPRTVVRPGQGEGFEFAVSPLDVWPTPAVRSAALGAAGAQTHLSERAMALMVGVGDAVASGLPDPESALVALEAYVEENKDEATRIGTQLRTIKAENTRRQNRRWARLARTRFAAEIAEYQKALAGFEAVADDGQIVRLNALVKSFTASMRVER